MANMSAIEKRLDRFEFQLDEIRAALIQMAKTEERVAIILEQNVAMFKTVSDLQNRLNDVEKENATQQQSIGLFERAAWIVAGAVASIGTWWVTK